MEKVTLYIPCYNAEDTIKECLESIISQSYEIDEILLIDDGSNDRSVEIAKEYPVRIISHKENKRLAAARNTAFEEAKNEFVASLDADCVAHHQWLEKLMNGFMSDNIAGVGGRVIERYILGIADRWRAIHMPQNWGSEFIENPAFLYGSNSVFKKSVINSVGLYNNFLANNYEDVDISKRIYSRGFWLIYNPDAIVEHLRRDTANSILTTYWRWCFQAHINPHNINNMSRRIVARFLMIEEIFHKFFQEDLLNKNYILLPMDFLLLFYFPWLDLKYHFKKIKKNS